MLFVNRSVAQCLTGVGFVVNDTVCGDNEIAVTNTSVEVVDYSWDFFPKDLDIGVIAPVDKFSNSDTITDIRGVSFAIDTISGKIYSIVVERALDRMVGFELDSSYANPSSSINYGNLGNQITDSRSSIRFKDNVGFLSNYPGASPRVMAYFFTSGLDQAPDSVHTFTNTALNEFSAPGNLRLVGEGGKTFLLVCNATATRHISVLSLDSSLANTPALIQKVDLLNTINNSNYAVDLDIIKLCNNYLAYVLLNNGTLTLLNFGNSLLNTPSKTIIPQINIGGTATNIKVIHSGGKTKVFCLEYNNTLSSFQFDATGLIFENPLNIESAIFSSGNNDTRSFDIIKVNSTYLLLGGNRSGAATNRGVYLGSFGNSNFNSNSVSIDSVPLNLPYTNPGNSYLSLYGVDTSGNISSKIDSITLLEFIPVDFQSSGFCLDNLIDFTDLSTSQTLNTQSWNWNFGDGDTSILQNPSHQYLASGSYDVSLEIEASNGCVSSNSDTITISDLRPEFPDFDYSPQIVCENTLVTFYDSTTIVLDSVVSYIWYFGDGDSSNSSSPSHQYVSTGNYTASMVIKGRFGCDTAVSKIITVQAGPNPAFVAQDFCSQAATLFFDSSTTIAPSVVNNWYWQFGDGNSANVQNPPHTYSTPGIYSVSLQIETDSGCLASTSSNVTIEDLPDVNFNYSIPCAQNEVTFTSGSGGGVVAWDWSNANNPNDTTSSPTFIFPNAGFEDISLTVENSSGCIASITRAIEIFPAFLPDFEAEQICIGDTTLFTDITPSFSIINRTWDFDLSNQTSSLESPSFYYPTTGSYNVSLSVTNAIGCQNEISKTVELRNLPVVDVLFDNTCEGAASLLYDNSNTLNGFIASQTWDIEGNTFMGDTISYVFDAAGDYPISLDIIDNFNCQNDTSIILSVFSLPVANFNFSPNYGSSPIDIQLANESSIDAISYLWDFGDGSGNSIDENPLHQYSQNGIYNIFLVASTLEGCADSASRSISIIPTELDIELSDFSIQKTPLADGSLAYKPSILLKNVGTRTIFNVDLSLSVNNETQIAETWEGELNVGQSVLYALSSFAIIDNESLVDYICLEAQNVNDNTELNFTNNKICAVQNGSIQSSDLYPNPAKELVHLDIVMEKKGQAQIGIFDMLGKAVVPLKDLDLEEGYNLVSINTAYLQAGKYLVNLVYQDELVSYPLIIQNP